MSEVKVRESVDGHALDFEKRYKCVVRVRNTVTLLSISVERACEVAQKAAVLDRDAIDLQRPVDADRIGVLALRTLINKRLSSASDWLDKASFEIRELRLTWTDSEESQDEIARGARRLIGIADTHLQEANAAINMLSDEQRRVKELGQLT